MEKICVLVIEDNPDDFFLLKEFLEASEDIDFTILHSDRFEKTISIVEQNRVDVAIIDLQLPDSIGIDTFLSFHERFPIIPSVIMTGNRDREMALKAVRAGAQEYLYKGEFSSGTIVRTIRHAIERHRLMMDLRQTQYELHQTLEAARIREKEIKGLLRGARAVLEQENFLDTAKKVFSICCELTGASSGYVALLSDAGEENEVLFLESGGLPCNVDPELPMPIRGLREVAYRTNSVVYDNRFMDSKWAGYMPQGHVRLENVMFSPLVIQEKTVGIIGLANKQGDFTKNDADIAAGFGELAAIALQNSRNLEKREMAEQQKETLIEELTAALASVKQLSGLVPICSHCKKIRDDKGYWNQIEAYIQEHSEAKFSHGICQECAKKHYPDLDLYKT